MRAGTTRSSDPTLQRRLNTTMPGITAALPGVVRLHWQDLPAVTLQWWDFIGGICQPLRSSALEHHDARHHSSRGSWDFTGGTCQPLRRTCAIHGLAA